MATAYDSQQPFSPIDILSRLPSMGGNLRHGKQEDAHEFMRFAIDMMQSVCLDEHGGEKVIHRKSQETTLIQHIYGGQLRSQVKCVRCSQVSNQYENMMDLTVEIQGDATSLQDCLDQFTAKELLQGENMYKCDRCKDYVTALKRLTIHQAPNILTIALKRFESGIFGKINKKITFPEKLNLSQYMSEDRDGTDKYELYAVVVHVDMLNASFFGHYICYTKSFTGYWHRMDDCKVTKVQLDDVLSQGAYMLLYKRISPRPKCLKTFEPTFIQEQVGDKMAVEAEDSCPTQKASSSNFSESSSSFCSTADPGSDLNKQLDDTHIPLQPRTITDLGPIDGGSEGSHTVNPVSGQPAPCCSFANSASDKNQQLEHVQAPIEPLSGVNLDPDYGSLEDSQATNLVSALPSSVEVCMNGNDDSKFLTAADATSIGAFGDTSCEAAGAALKSDEETRGILEECCSEVEFHIADNTQDSAAALVGQTAPLELNCFSNGFVTDFPLQRYNKKTKTDDYSPSPDKVETQAVAEDMDVASVELNEPSNCYNGVIDGMILDGTSTNTSVGMTPEKPPCAHCHDSCVFNGHVEPSDKS